MIKNKQALSDVRSDSKKPQATPLKTADIPEPAQSAVDSVNKTTEDAPEEPLPNPHVHFEIDTADFLSVIDSGISSNIQALNLTVNAYRLGFRSSYDQ